MEHRNLEGMSLSHDMALCGTFPNLLCATAENICLADWVKQMTLLAIMDTCTLLMGTQAVTHWLGSSGEVNAIFQSVDKYFLIITYFNILEKN